MFIKALFPLWLSLVLSIFSNVQNAQTWSNLLNKKNDYRTVDKTYDYIVVGGGSAG
ncbi:hypothetical protein K502DRAFT_354123, partial [Neoconidiobolus thromboides FSU 785]